MIDAAWFTPAAVGAGSVFAIGVTACLIWQVANYRNRQRMAPRFEPATWVSVEPIDEPAVPDVLRVDLRQADFTPTCCPGCGRNAGHDEECYVQRQERRASEIQIPRDGETL